MCEECVRLNDQVTSYQGERDAAAKDHNSAGQVEMLSGVEG